MSDAVVGHEVHGWADTRRRVGRNRMVVTGLVLLGLFAILAFIHPLLQATLWASKRSVYLPLTGFDPAILHPSGPSPAHLLGTDPLGRDVLSMVTNGLRPSFIVAIAAAGSSAAIGLVVGTGAALLRGRFDRVATHVADAFILLPPPLVFLIAAKRGLLGPLELGLLYGLFFGLGPAAIVVRSRALAVMEKPFVDAARVAGGGSRWIVTHHVVPHVLSHVATIVLAGVVGALVTQGFVEYLGIGEYRIGLGSLVYNGLTYRGALGTGIPWSTVLAGALTISLLASSFYLISAGLREAADPKLSRRRV